MGAPAPAPTMAAQPTAQPNATYQPAAMAPQQGFNVNQAAAGALQGAIGGTQRAMQAPLQVGAYANPYTSAVIDRTQQDIARQQQMASNQLGAQATAANAFGGSRQAVAEGVMAGEYGRMAGDLQRSNVSKLQSSIAGCYGRPSSPAWRSVPDGSTWSAGIWHRSSNSAKPASAGSIAARYAASSY